MKNALGTRQRLFGLVLPLTAALYVGAEGLDPKGTDQIVTTTAVALNVLPLAANHPTQLYASGSVSELALVALAISYGAKLVRRPPLSARINGARRAYRRATVGLDRGSVGNVKGLG